SCDFDGGNIIVDRIEGDVAWLRIRTDHLSDFYQWLYFHVAGAKDRALTLHITNCAASAYPAGWEGYSARYSAPGGEWRLADTCYADGTLTIRHTPAQEHLEIAYFAPYSSEKHTALIARIAACNGVSHQVLGRSLDGRPIDYLTLGTGPTQVWLYARQHPGETMAEWWMEGALEWLTNPANEAAKALRAKATLHIIPNMNPDGSARGHLRTNACGANLNREWAEPTAERSPEVLCVRNRMDETGVDWAMDVHGDESIPANFIAGFEGIPNWRDEQGAAFYAFRNALAARTPDFQTRLGYPPSKPGRANLTMSTNQLANRFGAVAMTLEMPFKDHASNPDSLHGWS
ncbi:MAG: carboxypeptidase family protein, partial [Alphaproteobacteria bacterium]|nr:carboxypeptidase family protein [Alphaproteobacteria bacterium]